MGLGDLFQKKTVYFDKKITPKCGYCQFGRRSKSGNILCEKQGIMNEDNSCSKFAYSPLKRIPVKQLKNEGAMGDEEIYAEVNEKEAEKPAEKTAQAEMPAASDAPEKAAPDEAADPAEKVLSGTN